MWVGLGRLGRFWFHPNAANSTRNIMDLNLPYEENADKKKKRKRRKHRKIKECVGDEESEEVKEV